MHNAHPVLEEVRVEVLVEPVLELHGALPPVDLVGEGHLGVGLQLDLALGGQVNVDDLAAVVTDVEALVSPNVKVLARVLHLAHDAWFFFIKKCIV